uniref:Abhydrolase_3 domain-containing protein n=1 Tax=Parastrongyloides trichosuri TaxID=131310 RepID=A0A0N4ZSC2_PARTI
MGCTILTKIKYYILYIIHVIFIKPIPKNCANKYAIRFVGLLIKLYAIFADRILSICVSQKFLIKIDRAYFHFLASLSLFRLPKWVKIENTKIGGIDCRVYLPQGTHRKSNGAIIYLHGGCWSMMRPKHLDEHMMPFLKRIGCPIISVDYRLSPEYPFPHGLNDSWIAASTFCEIDYKKYNVDANQVVIMGDSAGGNFTAAIIQRCKRLNKNYFQAQILIYPAVGCCDVESPSFQDCDKTYADSTLIQPSMVGRMLLEYLGLKASRKITKDLKNNKLITKEFMESEKWKTNINYSLLPKKFIDSQYFKPSIHEITNSETSYLFCEMLKNPDFAPLLADECDVVGLPPAMVITCGYDVLRDEGALYANKLSRNNVSTSWNHYENAYHGIFTLSGGSTRKKLFKDLISFIEIYIKQDGDIIDNTLGYKALIKWKRMIVSIPSLFPKKIPEWIEIMDDKIKDVKCRIYKPKSIKNNSLIIYIHGGGFAILSPRDFDDVLMPILKEQECMAISIDYSLSPEHIYPVAVNECWDVCNAILNESFMEDYKINPTKVTIMGDSAGGALAAVVCQRAIKTGKQQFQNQILIYPCTNFIDYYTQSQLEYHHKGYSGEKFLTPQTMARYGLMYMGIVPTKEKIAFMNKNGHICEKLLENEEFKKCYEYEYLPDEYKLYKRFETSPEITKELLDMKMEVFHFLLDPDFSPLYSEPKIFKQMPNTFVLTANDDVLRDDGIMYSEKIRIHGGKSTLKNYNEARHGCLNFPFDKYREFMLFDIINFLK